MTNDDIENLIQELYAWKAKRESTNTKRSGESGFKDLDNRLLHRAIKAIQFLQANRPVEAVKSEKRL